MRWFGPLCHVSMFPVFKLPFTLMLFPLSEQKTITAQSGHNVTLTCGAPTNSDPILAVQWSRADLEPDYVLLYRDEQFVPDNQHPSFKNRVDLQDRQMKDGDVSVILKNVTVNDTGTYKCRVFRRRAAQLIRSIYLSVVPPGELFCEAACYETDVYGFGSSSAFPTVGACFLSGIYNLTISTQTI
uniref:Ig-like domain-containing protein n=1 Tax=Amphilophus citrinellus TaxID=61819 RepID=A0A3Q0S3E4_AMPCI